MNYIELVLELRAQGYPAQEDPIRQRVLCSEFAPNYSSFTCDDIHDWSGFVTKLRAASASSTRTPARRICELLELDLSFFDSHLAPGENCGKSILVAKLRALLNRRDFYDPTSFANVRIPQKEQNLIDKGISYLDRLELTNLNHGLLHCAFPMGVRPDIAIGSLNTGIGFWMQQLYDYWFVGLWSGLFYRLEKTEKSLDLATSMLAARFSPSGMMPPSLPINMTKEYGLRSCWEVHACTRTKRQRLSEAIKIQDAISFRKQELIDASYAASVQNVKVKSYPMLELTLDGAVVLIVFDKCWRISDSLLSIVVVRESERPCSAEMSVLRALARELDLSMFDGTWENQIDFSDPYYARPTLSHESEKAPRNAELTGAEKGMLDP